MVVNGPSPAGHAAGRLETARRDLLDLSLRNNLLNYRLLKSRGVEVVDESPVEVFRLLAREGRTLTFQPAPEQTQLDLQIAAPPTPEETATRQTDRYLQTAEAAPRLQERLLKTYYTARTYIEEQGVNILYLALGMLEWYEADNARERRRAPLLLLPVTLERSDIRDRFHLQASGEDIGENLSLTAMLSANFGLTAPPLPEADDLEIDAYFDAYAAVVARQPRWAIDRSAIALGFFSFGKFLMYRDLAPSSWAADAQPADHPVIRALLQDGFQEEPSPFSEDTFLDIMLRPGELHEVLDADSSQTLALLDARAGRHLVIQGPPGTGKSQTIANLIAESIASGKTVLFVAEKLAALEVVKRRLDAIGLGDACLELHSHKINKKTVLAELQRTLELGRPQATDRAENLQQLSEVRERLNAYCEAINQPIGASGVTPFQALGALARLQQEPGSDAWPQLSVPHIALWNRADAARRTAIAEEFQLRIARMGAPSAHPFWGVGLQVLLPTDEAQLKTQLADALESEAVLRAACRVLAGLLGLEDPPSRGEARELIDIAERLLTAPELAEADVAAPEWLAAQADVQTLLTNGSERTRLRALRGNEVTPEAWDADLGTVRADLNAYRDAWWRVLSGRYRQARRTLAGYCSASVPGDVAEQVALVDDLLAAQRADAEIERLRPLGEKLFGSLWRGPASDWPHLQALATWLTDLHEDEQAERLPRGSVAVISARRTPQGLEPAINGLRHALEREAASFSALSTALEFSSSRRFGASADEASQPFSMRRELLEEWRDNLPRLAEMTAFNVSAARCASEEMAPLAAVAESWPEAGRNLAALLDATRYRALIDTAFRERPALATFDGDSHAGVVARFRQLDALQIEYNRAALAQQHWNAMPQVDAGGQLGVLRREFQKRARHLPVRQLVQRAGAAIQAIKPVFMMSPLSIATYLPAGAVQFDLVVFDEASQVRPVDAFGALLRGKQAVVVGDEKQLPPTSFFDSLTEADGADEDALITSDYQSVLELFLAQSAPKRMLRWHYRSRHQSLIAVSNQEFYENKLVVFPSPSDTTAGAGLVFHHLPQTAYERGGSRTNPQEAAIVARAVMQHAAEHPELTLGVASFSISQTNAIRDELERLRREDPSSEAFFAAHPHEPFFVKNLENVQGDERDVIFISVGYGRDANGYLSMHFGPLNDAGGERRLNVLITRARLRCEVFSNITDDDLDLERSPAAGVRALKQFLRYARTGLLDLPEASGRPAGSPFETAVEQALLRAGYQVHRQVGSAGFFIDLAIVDPQRPGRYLLGIECDGASYHSARSARDRDRLRQLVLERLGWTIYRIWSVDWFRDPDGELRHVVTAIEAARAGGAPSLVSGASAATSIARAETGNGPVSRSLPSYRMANLRLNTRGRQLPDIDPDILADWVSTVVATESPVHAEEVIRRICTAAGVGRVGARIHSALSYAIALAAARERIVIRGAFLWLPGMTTPQPRDRAALDSTARDLALVAPEEIDLVVEMVVRDAVAIDPEQVAPAVARLFGFQRLTDTMRAEIDPRIRTLLATGRLVEHNGQLRPATQVDTTGGMR